MRRWVCWIWLAVAPIALAGCVASADVKLASAQMTAALQALESGERKLAEAFAKQVDEVQADTKRAIVARTVKAAVAETAAAETSGDLVALSEKIETTQAATRALVDHVGDLLVKDGADVNGVIDAFLKDQASALRRVADRLQAREPKAAEALRERAKQIEQTGAAAPAVRRADLEVILRLTATKTAFAAGLQTLERHIAALRAIHAVVNEWIMTDVTVSGKDVADLVSTHAGTLRLGAPKGSR